MFEGNGVGVGGGSVLLYFINSFYKVSDDEVVVGRRFSGYLIRSFMRCYYLELIFCLYFDLVRVEEIDKY